MLASDPSCGSKDMYMYVHWLKKLVKITTTRAHVSVWDCHMMSSQLAALKHMPTTPLTLLLPQPSTMPSDVTLLVFEVATMPNIEHDSSSCDNYCSEFC